METTDETLIAEETEQAAEAALKESWPLPWEDTVREFEEYLLDIGVRI